MGRLKDWLIVKLGGEPLSEVHAHVDVLNNEIQNLNSQVAELEAKLENSRLKVLITPTNKPIFSITKTGYRSAEEAKNLEIKYVYQEIAEDIAEELIEQNFIYYQTTKDTNGEKITGTVQVIKPEASNNE